MKMKLNIHSDWKCWLAKLLEVTQDYAPVLPLWIFSYKRLFSDHKIRPPSWVKAWLETKMTMDSMTKDKLRVWRLVQNKIGENSTQYDISGQQDDGSTVSAAPAQEQTDSRRRVSQLLEAGHFCLHFSSIPQGRAGRAGAHSRIERTESV